MQTPDRTDCPGDATRLMVVVAHLDDETFGCGSLLLYASAAGVDTAVCCATRGEAGEVAAGVEVPVEGLGGLRESELRRAATVLGVGSLEVLDFADSGMSGPCAPSALAGGDPRTLVAAVRASVEAFAPDVLVTLDASDGHRDHERVRDATIEVGAGLGLPVYLQCLPRSLMDRWIAAMTRSNPENAYLALVEIGTPDELVTQVLDTTPYLADRERAIAEHASQVSPFAALPQDLREAFLTSEHLQLVATSR